MKILFVSRYKPVFGMGRFVLHQAESLRRCGVNVDHFTIKGKGLRGYLSLMIELKNHIKKNSYDIIHSHYSYSSVITALAINNKKKFVVSLLGSDLHKNGIAVILTRFFVKHFAGTVIVKTEEMKRIIKLEKVNVVPNGVNLERFRIINKEQAKKQVGFNSGFHILFFSNPPERPEKNLKLANEVFTLLPKDKYELHVLSKTPNEEVPIYMNAADAILMTSLHEGSPNVIKEAMACNLPIISVDVGDVKARVKDVDNCYVVSYNPLEIKDKVLEVTKIKRRSNGRDQLIKQELDEKSVAVKIISIYNKLLS